MMRREKHQMHTQHLNTDVYSRFAVFTCNSPLKNATLLAGDTTFKDKDSEKYTKKEPQSSRNTGSVTCAKMFWPRPLTNPT